MNKEMKRILENIDFRIKNLEHRIQKLEEIVYRHSKR